MQDYAALLAKLEQSTQRVAVLETALVRVRAYVPTPEEAARLLPLAFAARLTLVGVVVDDVLATDMARQWLREEGQDDE
jgi:hypothetical protein